MLLLTIAVLFDLAEIYTSGMNQGGRKRPRLSDQNPLQNFNSASLGHSSNSYSSSLTPNQNSHSPSLSPSPHSRSSSSSPGSGAHSSDSNPEPSFPNRPHSIWVFRYKTVNIEVMYNDDGTVREVRLQNDNKIPTIAERSEVKTRVVYAHKGHIRFLVFIQKGKFVGAMLARKETSIPAEIPKGAFQHVLPLSSNPEQPQPNKIFPFRNKLIGIWKDHDGKVKAVSLIPQGSIMVPNENHRQNYGVQTHKFHRDGIDFRVFRIGYRILGVQLAS